jgi:hypothetical protein
VDDPHPGIELSIPRVCCPLHGEAFRHEWPKGFMPFALSLLQGVLASPQFVEECEANVEWVNGALDREPLCERVDSETLLAALRDCGIGKDGTCENCRETRAGVRMQLAEPGTTVPRWIDHVCFECIVFRLRLP